MAVEIENATRLYLQYEEDGRTLGKLREQADKAGNEWRDLVTGLLDSDDTSAISEILEAIDIERLRSASQEALEVSKRVYRAQDTLERTREPHASSEDAHSGHTGRSVVCGRSRVVAPCHRDISLPSLPEPFPLVAGGVAVAGLLSLVLAITGIRPGSGASHRSSRSWHRRRGDGGGRSGRTGRAMRTAIPGERILGRTKG